MSAIPAPANWKPQPPKMVTRGVLYQFWQQLGPEKQADMCKTVKTMLHVKGLPQMGDVIVPLRLLELYQTIGGGAHYSIDAVAKAAMDNCIGQIFHEGKLVTDWRELSPKQDSDGLPRSVRTATAIQPTAKLWIPTFVLPKDGEKIVDYQQYCLIKENIERDLESMLKAKAELDKVAGAAIALCEDGKAQLDKVAAGWAVVGNLTEEVAKIQKALEGLQALGDNDPAVSAVIQRQQDRMATAKTHLAAATQAAQDGKVWVLEEPAKEQPKKSVGKKSAGD